MTLEENIALGSPGSYSRRGGLGSTGRPCAPPGAGRIAELGLSLPDARQKAGTLSGGNAQRFLLARELAREPQLLVALYPDARARRADRRGGAAAAPRAARARLRRAARLAGPDELTALSDRLLVMRDGRIVAELDPKTADAYEIGTHMTGSGEKAAS